jgi:hypothetical protein
MPTASAGGAMSSTLNNCIVSGNSANGVPGTTYGYGFGGGAYGTTLNNCIVYYNSVMGTQNPNYSSSTLNYCCTAPLPTSGLGNIADEPLFENLATGDFQLQSNSPCINSGNNAYVTTTTDLDGNPRIAGGTVDVGVYEYQTPVSMVSYEWLEQYELLITTNTDTSSPNGTPFDVYQDWIAGLNPTNLASLLMMLSPTTTNNAPGITVSWESVSGIDYNLLRATNITSAWATIQSNIIGQAGTTSYTDTSATNGGPYFYRVGVP